eukprot:COSAG02_NODE_53454_length_301_cov_2.178218_1_plen_48_part_01
MTVGGSKHSAQIKIDIFPQMRAGWRGSWRKMGGGGARGHTPSAWSVWG